MPPEKLTKQQIESAWYSYLMHGKIPPQDETFFQKIFLDNRLAKRLPSEPRCRVCHIPFKGLGGAVMRLIMDRRPSKLNPQICNDCEQFAEKYHGGAQVEMSILFADVRGSTRMAEELGTTEFTRIIDRFYQVSTHLLVESDALIEKLIGDEVTGIFLPGFSGQQHASVAINTALKLLAATGHQNPHGPWVPVGIGIHTGTAYMGAVGQPGGVTDIVALGEAVNTAARITSQAAPGEILISEDARAKANYSAPGLLPKELHLRDMSVPVPVWSLSMQSHYSQE